MNKINELLERCKERVDLGENNLLPLLSRLSGSQHLENICYHSDCRKPIMHTDHKERSKKRMLTEPLSGASKRGPGRPQKTATETRPQRYQTVPKEVKCIFEPGKVCSSSVSDNLHRVESEPMGQKLLDIKKNSKSDEIRVCVSGLEAKGDAAAQEKYYHRACLRNAQRSCIDKVDEDKLTRNICDELMLLSVKCSLFVNDAIKLSMNDINNEYISILEDYSIHDTYSTNHKKYLKELLKEHIPAIQFIKSVRRNESEMVSLSLSVSQAMEEYSQTTSVDALVSVAKVLREDILSNRDWKFSTGLGNSKNPPMLQFLLNQILFGTIF